MKTSIHSYPTYMDYLTRVIFYETCWLDELPAEVGQTIISMTHRKRSDPQTQALRELHRSKAECLKCPLIHDCGDGGQWTRGRDLSNHICPCVRKIFIRMNDPTSPHYQSNNPPEGYTGDMRFISHFHCECEVHIPDPGSMIMLKLMCDTRRDYITDCFTQLSITRSGNDIYGRPLNHNIVTKNNIKFQMKMANSQMFKTLQSNSKDTLSRYDRGDTKCMGFTAKGTPCKCNTVGQGDYNHNKLPSVTHTMLPEVCARELEIGSENYAANALTVIGPDSPYEAVCEKIEKKWIDKQIADMGILSEIPAFSRIYNKVTYNYDDMKTERTEIRGLRQMCGRCSKRYNHSLGPKKTDITPMKLLENHGYGIRNGYVIIK